MEDKGLIAGVETLIVYPIDVIIGLIKSILNYPFAVLNALFDTDRA